MYYSLNLLKQFISLDDTPNNIANYLTAKSCEIEQVKTRSIPDQVIVSKVLDVKSHPNADKLVICQVDCGSMGTFQICTGATNVQTHQYVPVAIVGCYLPAIDLKIGKRTMRGEASDGMICAKEELGIMEDMDLHGIWDLSQDFAELTDQDIGKKLNEIAPWLANTLLDVDNKTITNRADLTGHFGLATELYTIYQHVDPNKIIFHNITKLYDRLADPNLLNILTHGKQTTRTLNIQTNNCHSYVLVELNNIRVKPSSLLSRMEMLDSGAQPRNNWVDYSNIFSLTTGQPVHFFDADKVQGTIIVRQARNGEQFTDLFDTTHTLTDQDMVIADESKILALAGVVGGNNSGVTNETKHILVEIANFDPVSIRKTATRIGLRTDAVMRYEKDINPIYTLHCFEFLMDFLARKKPDYVFGGSTRRCAEHRQSRITRPNNITLDLSTAYQKIFGNKVIDTTRTTTASTILSNLGFQQQHSPSSHSAVFKIPHWRSPKDINIAEDIIEELARIYSYDNIPASNIHQPLHYQALTEEVRITRIIEETLVRDAQADQLETYPWVDESVLDIFDIDKTTLLSLKNPLAPETKYLRNSLIYNLLLHIKKNHKFFDNMIIFDIGKIWDQSNGKHSKGAEESQKDSKTNNQLQHCATTPSDLHEHNTVGIILYQKKHDHRQSDSLLHCKTILSRINKQLELQECHYTLTDKPYFHPKKQGTILIPSSHSSTNNNKGDKTTVGYLGQLHPSILQALKINHQAQIIYAELDLSLLPSLIQQSQTRSHYHTLQDQIITRDLCFVIDQDQTFETIINAVKHTSHIDNVSIFDVYQGEKLPTGKKSIALTITIQGDGTMTNDQINTVMDQAIANAKKAGGELR